MESVVESECCSSAELKRKENADSTGSFERRNLIKEETSHGKKPSKVTSVLDTYCKTNLFDDSFDFIKCNFKQKLNHDSNKTEIFCEICKEIITHLDVQNREMHVNNCIDKQNSLNSKIHIHAPEVENAFVLECPLCFKQFSSTELRASHIKKCGKSKGLSTQSVMRALELQERHALERISLGLPAKPIKLVKPHKNLVHKKAVLEPKSKAHSDIQLAKALSLSLATSVQKEEDISLKPHVIPGKIPKASPSVTPLLVLRTEEERKRLLLDKVATVVTPSIRSEDELHSSFETNEIMSKENHDSSVSLLWCLSGKASERRNYYIEDLMDWIGPSDGEVGVKLQHLSQIPGHKILTQLPCDYTFSTPESRENTDCGTFSVIECLRSLVASSWMSDVDIHTSCGTVIPAHRLLLAARCPYLKQDSDFCGKSGKVILKWEAVSFDAALQFLNFVYTGNIDIKDDMKSNLMHLANKYEVLDLQKLLHAAEISSNMESDARMLLNDDKVCGEPQDVRPTNVDLDIVYKCISSSMAPSQPSGSETEPQKMHPSQNCDEWQERTVQKDTHPASQVVFDATNDSLDIGLPRTLVQSDLGIEELDLCSTESNDSQDSIKFLKSSFSSNYSFHSGFEKDISLQKLSEKSSSNLTSTSPTPDPALNCSDAKIHHFSSKSKFHEHIEESSGHLDPMDGKIEEKFKIGSTKVIGHTRSENIMCSEFVYGKCETSTVSIHSSEPSIPGRSAGKRGVSQVMISSFDLNIPSSPLSFHKTFLENEYPGTPSKVSHKSSSVTESSTVEGFPDHFDRKTKGYGALNEKDVSCPNEPCEYVQEKSEITPLHDSKATTSSGDSAGFQLSDSPITPLPDYKNMVTPEIKQALRRIGVKALPRKKAIRLLSHVYDETHPLVCEKRKGLNCSQIFMHEDTVKEKSKSKKRKILSESTKRPSKKCQKEIQNISHESDDNNSDNPEWDGCVPEISFSQFQEDSPTKGSRDDIESMRLYIQSNEDLFAHILIYKPLNLMELHQELKDNGIKVSIQKLTDFLDEQCITFTCPRKEEYQKKQMARAHRFRKNMIAKLSQQLK